ncbi:hypothetical protein KAR91_62705 [Candidatus Pacearchaeota archaeon]|nr:hypothetical protein [Candidatus Pacearchaeota archaeon]
MSTIDLGGAKSSGEPEKQQMIYMSIPTTILLMVDIQAHPPAKQYVEALTESIKQAVPKKTIRKEIFSLFGVKTVKKMLATRPREYGVLTAIFGVEIWK